MRRQLSYANVMATVAVFIALGGSSYAAIKITGKNVTDGTLTGADVKNSSLTGTDIKNKSLTAVDFKGSVRGPEGATGPKGATGPQGDRGLQGVKGDTGQPGPFPAELPSGKTLTGVYSVSGVATAAGQYSDMPISFGFRFASAPTVVTVGINDTAQQATAAGCPGTAADPNADPGKICLYEMGRDNTSDLVDAPKEAGGAVARVAGYTPPVGDFGTATRFGTIVEVLSAGAGNLYSNGVWAATSP
jgi:hypothetical protein